MIEFNILIPVLGLSYAAFFSLLAWLEREGISLQFIGESLLITVFVSAGSLLTGSSPNNILFLVFLYLLTMRARLMIDWARLLIRRDRGPMAIDVLEIAQRMLPDKPARILIALYTGVAHLRSQDAPTAKTHLEKTLEMAAKGGLSSRNRTVCLYFLGHAHRLQGQTTEAKRSFREARDLMPKSPYAKAAAEALKEMRK